MNIENLITRCRHFTAIDVRFVSREIPPGVLSDKELKRYIHLCFSASDQYGQTWSGCNDFNRYCKCSAKEFRRINDRLISMGFVAAEPRSKKITTYTVKMLPHFDSSNEQFAPLLDCPKTGFAFKAHRIHFIPVPSEALRHILKLPRQELMVFIKLCRYNQFSVFEGIDPNAIRYQDGQWIIHPRLPYDLYMSEEDFVICVEELMEEGLLLRHKIGLSQESFDIEERLRVHEGNDAEIVVPLYQLEEASIQRETDYFRRLQ